jgi:PadR family transcriptional regulator, regulatory protein PadR
MEEQQRINLGSFEELVLLAIVRLNDEANAATVRQAVSEVRGRKSSMGAIYLTVDRLERKGLIRSHQGSSSGSGKTKRQFSITTIGIRALNDCKEMRDSLRVAIATIPF